MIAPFIIIILGLSFFYAFVNHNREFSATASAIQEIWSGSCRLSCRRSEYSDISELGDLDGVKAGPDQSIAVNVVDTSNDCVCETCPCELINKVLRTCSPATNLNSQFIENLSNFYYDIVKTLSELYSYVGQVMSSGTTCQRQNELRVKSTQNLGQKIKEHLKKAEKAGEKIIKDAGQQLKETSEKIKEEVKKVDKSQLNIKPFKSISFRKLSDDDDAGTSRPQSTNLQRDSSTVDSAKSMCSRCIEKGITCIGTCPRAKGQGK